MRSVDILIAAATAAQINSLASAQTNIQKVVPWSNISVLSPILDASSVTTRYCRARMTAVLKSNQPPCENYFCNRDGNPIVQANGPPIINSSRRLLTHTRQNHKHVNVVVEITWCGTFGFNIRGVLESAGGPVWLVTQENDPKIVPLLCLHEFSHTVGNPHRDSLQALMRPELKVVNTVINSSECAAMTTASSVSMTAVPPLPAKAIPIADAASRMPIDDFIRQSWPEGVPFTQVSQALLQMTTSRKAGGDSSRDHTQSNYWSTVVATLGAIGSVRARDVLTHFLLSDPDATLPLKEYKAKASVPPALGWLVSLEAKSPVENLIGRPLSYFYG